MITDETLEIQSHGSRLNRRSRNIVQMHGRNIRARAIQEDQLLLADLNAADIELAGIADRDGSNARTTFRSEGDHALRTGHKGRTVESEKPNCMFSFTA